MSWVCCSGPVSSSSQGRRGSSRPARCFDVALNATTFFRNESCGKCVPCRVGSQKLVLIGEQLAHGTIRCHREAGRTARPGAHPQGDHGADFDLQPGHLRAQAVGLPVRTRLEWARTIGAVPSPVEARRGWPITTADSSSPHVLGTITDRESIDEHRTGNQPGTSG